MSHLEKTAREIAENLLERTGHGLISGDFEAFLECFTLPKEMETFDGRRVLTTPEDMRKVFDDVRAYHRKIGMTEMERHIVDAEFRNRTTIVSTHQTRYVADDQLVQQPFDVLSVIEKVGDVWRIRHSQYAIVDSDDHNRALIGSGAKLTDEKT